MKSEFTADFFRGNRERLRKLFTGTAPIVLTANGLLQKATDETFRFRQDGSFWYLTGIDEPNVILVMDKGKEYLIIPDLTPSRIAFDGAIDTEVLSAKSGIAEVLLEKDGWKRLGGRLKRASSVAVLSPADTYIKALGMYTNPARQHLIREMKRHNAKLTLLDLRQHLQRMRMVKQPAEIKTLTHAIAITTGALKKIERSFRKGQYKHEFEIEMDLTRYFWQGGGSGHGFEPIVAAGAKASTIHPFGNTARIRPNQPLLLDVAAAYDHYTADISRCWTARPTKRYRAVYETVKEVADFAMASLKPGVIMKEYEKQVEYMMGEKLRELGLIRTIEHEAVRHYFPHATSHFLGIDVHDLGDYGHPIEPGVIVTVEPGIYIPEEGIGIRIEDDILITPEGSQNLSAGLAR